MEFRLIHELCLYVLNASQKPDLIRSTLSTLHAYLSWVPLAYIFNSNMVEVLLKLFPQAPFRNVALQCLTEVSNSAPPPCSPCLCGCSALLKGILAKQSVPVPI
jgi:exportin-1